MTMETSEVQKRVRALVEHEQAAARARRERAAVAHDLGDRALARVVAPVVKMIAAALMAEGYSFRVSTPSGSVRLTAVASPDDFVEVVLDGQRDLTRLIARVSRRWGRRVLVEEHVLREDVEIGDLTDGETLDFFLKLLGPFVEK